MLKFTGSVPLTPNKNSRKTAYNLAITLNYYSFCTHRVSAVIIGKLLCILYP